MDNNTTKISLTKLVNGGIIILLTDLVNDFYTVHLRQGGRYYIFQISKVKI